MGGLLCDKAEVLSMRLDLPGIVTNPCEDLMHNSSPTLVHISPVVLTIHYGLQYIVNNLIYRWQVKCNSTGGQFCMTLVMKGVDRGQRSKPF